MIKHNYLIFKYIRHRFLSLSAALLTLVLLPMFPIWANVKGTNFAQIKNTVRKYAPYTLSVSLDDLTQSDRNVVAALVQAGPYIDRIYMRQLFEEGPQLWQLIEIQLRSKPSDDNKLLRDYFAIHKNPYDSFNDYKPFIQSYMPKDTKSPLIIPPRMDPGRNFYPPNLTLEAFNSWTDKLNILGRKLARSDFSVVRRNAKNELIAIPYNDFFANDLRLLSRQLDAAASYAQHPGLKTFLSQRADAFLTNAYEQSEKSWIALNADPRKLSDIEVTMGPYENYDDELLKTKAGFQLYISRLRKADTDRLELYRNQARVMDKYLWRTLQEYYKRKKPIFGDTTLNRPRSQQQWKSPGRNVTLVTVDLIYSAGMAGVASPALAYSLPNIAEFREKYGSKKVMMMNVIAGKFDRILLPIAKLVLEPEIQQHVDRDLFADNTVRHEMAHGIGPAEILIRGRRTTVRENLGKYYSAYEEAKADIIGLMLGGYLVKQKKIKNKLFLKKMAATYVASIFRSIRFGTTSDHAKGRLLQLRRLTQNGALTYLPKSGRFRINFEKFPLAVERLGMELINMQYRGSQAAAKKLLNDAGRTSPALKKTLARIDAAKIPVDLKLEFGSLPSIRND